MRLRGGPGGGGAQGAPAGASFGAQGGEGHFYEAAGGTGVVFFEGEGVAQDQRKVGVGRAGHWPAGGRVEGVVQGKVLAQNVVDVFELDLLLLLEVVASVHIINFIRYC